MANCNLGQRISDLRREKGLSQEQLGNELGISAQAVSKWENGKSMPDVAILPDIADLFNCSIDELFLHQAPANGINLPWKDDGNLRGVLFVGHRVVQEGEDGNFTFNFEDEGTGVSAIFTQGANVNIGGDFHGDCAIAQGFLTIKGDLNGDCSVDGDAPALAIQGGVGGDCSVNGQNASLAIQGDVEGDCSVSGGLHLQGDVCGNCTVCGGASIGGDVHGDFTLSNKGNDCDSVIEGDVAGNVTCDGRLTVKGDIQGNVVCGSLDRVDTLKKPAE